MAPSFRLALVASCLVLACKQSGDTAPPDDDDDGEQADADVASDDADAAEVPSDVPPSVPSLAAMPNAKLLGSKMWRRFGKGEWTAHSFFVPDVKARAVTVIVDMEGGGEAVSDPFELVVEPQGLTLVEGEPRKDGRVPPGMKRREQWKFTAPQLGIAKIRFATVKDGEEKGGTTACLNFSEDTIYRCTESQAAGIVLGAKGGKHTYCCAKGKGESGQNCDPIADDVDAIKSCMTSKRFTLSCEGEVACTGRDCKCK